MITDALFFIEISFPQEVSLIVKNKLLPQKAVRITPAAFYGTGITSFPQRVRTWNPLYARHVLSKELFMPERWTLTIS
jgi:hypothetical protein